MNKTYLILIDGRLAKRRLTLKFALKDKKDLEAKGFKMVSIAEDVQSKEVR